jgi:hypothetical protein
MSGTPFSQANEAQFYVSMSGHRCTAAKTAR